MLIRCLSNRWLKECAQLTVRNLSWVRHAIDGSLVRMNLFCLFQFLNFQKFYVLDTEPGLGSELANFTFVAVSCW